MRHLRCRAGWVTALSCLLALVGCDGRSTSATPPTSSGAIVAADGRERALPAENGTSGRMTLPVVAGANASILVAATSTPVAASSRGQQSEGEFSYGFSVTPSVSLTLPSLPAITLTLPTSIPTANRSFFYAITDTTSGSSVVQSSGPAIVAGQQLTFTGTSTPLALVAAHTYVFTFSVLSSGGSSTANLYVAVCNGVNVYAAQASQDAAPAAVIAGPHTGIADPFGLAVDAQGTIYVGNLGDGSAPPSITVYAPGASGDATPVRTITLRSGYDRPVGLAVDGAGRLVVADYRVLEIFAAGASGAATPIAQIAGPHTGLQNPYDVAIDAQGHIVVLDAVEDAVSTFSSDANGDVAPLATVRGVLTGLSAVSGLGLDPRGGVFVADAQALTGSVEGFSASATGNASPSTLLEGSATGFDGARDVAVGSDGSIYVSDDTPRVAIFAPGANGDVAPVRIIAGPDTALCRPIRLVLVSGPAT